MIDVLSFVDKVVDKENLQVFWNFWEKKQNMSSYLITSSYCFSSFVYFITRNVGIV